MLNDILTIDQQWLNRSDRLSTNFMTFIHVPSLTFTELWVVSMEHLQRVWLASRERLPFRTPGSVPLFGTCLCPNCWDQIPRTCHVFTRLFTLNTPWYFLDFAMWQLTIFQSYMWRCIDVQNIKISTMKSPSPTVQRLLPMLKLTRNKQTGQKQYAQDHSSRMHKIWHRLSYV